MGLIPRTGFRAGDIIVTAVSNHYSIGQITTDGSTQQYLASEKDRADALTRASQLAGAAHRIFLWTPAGASSFVRVDCEAPTAPAPRRARRYS